MSTFQNTMAITKLVGVSLQVLIGDGIKTDITDPATARVFLNRHLRPDPPPLLPAPLSDFAMDTKQIKAVLRTLWKHEGFTWGNKSTYYDFMDVSIPIVSLSLESKHALRYEKKKTIKLKDIITVMEDPSQKPKLSKNYNNLSKREIHVLVIEALMKANKIDPENHHDSKILEDEFNRSWNIEEERREEPPKDDLKISPGASTNRNTSPLASPVSPPAVSPSSEQHKEALASPVTPINKAAVVRPVYFTTGKVGTKYSTVQCEQ